MAVHLRSYRAMLTADRGALGWWARWGTLVRKRVASLRVPPGRPADSGKRVWAEDGTCLVTREDVFSRRLPGFSGFDSPLHEFYQDWGTRPAHPNIPRLVDSGTKFILTSDY